ncbi:MAG: hypothetical protein QOH49_4770 [Acidobacteriota bacterium]|jgi:hypothetical protein|nr:hypothetical protein [Acidobacteriota bacterium]
MRQNSFFNVEAEPGERDAERLILYALGDFQERGKLLAGRDLPFDRLRGAFRRAAAALGAPELDDESVAMTLDALGANVRRVPTFVAKHPFRVIVPEPLAEKSRSFFLETKKTD